MIIVIFVLCVIIAIIGNILNDKYGESFVGCTATVCGVIGGAISFCAMIILLVQASYLSVIDNKIGMYQAENTKIEGQIAECVKQYQQYESEIFTEISPESTITLVSLYPELKADTLVAKQVEVYLSNNEEIKKLQKAKIEGDVIRWWAYFGKSERGGTK